jgi:hypothetical protein
MSNVRRREFRHFLVTVLSKLFEHTERMLFRSAIGQVVLAALLGASCIGNAHAQQETGKRETFQLREDSRIGGLLLGTEVGNATGDLPFHTPYASLTSAEKARVHSAYLYVGKGDEPPFPLEGLAALYDPIAKAQQKLLVEGGFYAIAEVDATGQVTNVVVHKSPSAKLSKFIGAVIVLTKFKPALCAGVPCTMGFPVRVNFTVH